MSEINAGIRELRRLEEDILFTEKAHFNSAARQRNTHLVIGMISTISAAIAAATVVANWSSLLAGIAAIVSTVASGLLTFLKPDKEAQQHLSAGRDLGALRVQIRQTMELDISSSQGLTPEMRDQISEYAKRKAELDRSAPSIDDRSFINARKKIRAGTFDYDHSQGASAQK